MKQHVNQVNGLENIKRVVVLMFENRSFDHLFGDFPNANGLFNKNGSFKENCYNLMNPLEPPSTDNPPYWPVPIDTSQPLQQDFTHDFGDGMMPDLFGPIFTVTGDVSNNKATYESGYKQGGPVGVVQPQPATYPETNSGFCSTYNSCEQQGQNVMQYFPYGSLKVLHTLADEFVLCDNWYCDMPGHTEPNRAFIHCATTGDTGIDDTDSGMVNAESIFDRIDAQWNGTGSPTWSMYAPIGSNGHPYHLDTLFLNEKFQNYVGSPIAQFDTDCQNNTLPFYSFIMCWTDGTTPYTDTSMHPQAMIQPGENLLAGVYNSLRNSDCWEDTLLIVTFDENGGIYDHVFPPTTEAPNPGLAPATQYTQGACQNNWILNSTFDFSLLGPRVPALLISPWLSKGIDSLKYQNTSVTRFVTDNMNQIYGVNSPYLTERDANAPVLDTVFSQFGTDTMRTDCPDWITPYSKLPVVDPGTGSDEIPYSSGHLTPWTPPAAAKKAPPVPYINEFLDIYVKPLPGHPDSGKKITRNFATNSEVAGYVKERESAAAIHKRLKSKVS